VHREEVWLQLKQANRSAASSPDTAVSAAIDELARRRPSSSS
jgi:sRNA-binding carbon storage regulator CsrA